MLLAGSSFCLPNAKICFIRCSSWPSQFGRMHPAALIGFTCSPVNIPARNFYHNLFTVNGTGAVYLLYVFLCMCVLANFLQHHVFSRDKKFVEGKSVCRAPAVA